MVSDYEGFENWINGMDEDEFIDMIDSSYESGGFSDKQEEMALKIRSPANEEDLEDIERGQESEVIEVSGKQPRKVYDTRDLPERPRYINTPSGDAIVLPEKQLTPSEQRIDRISNVQQSREIQKRSFLSRIKNFILRRK